MNRNQQLGYNNPLLTNKVIELIKLTIDNDIKEIPPFIIVINQPRLAKKFETIEVVAVTIDSNRKEIPLLSISPDTFNTKNFRQEDNAFKTDEVASLLIEKKVVRLSEKEFVVYILISMYMSKTTRVSIDNCLSKKEFLQLQKISFHKCGDFKYEDLLPEKAFLETGHRPKSVHSLQNFNTSKSSILVTKLILKNPEEPVPTLEHANKRVRYS